MVFKSLVSGFGLNASRTRLFVMFCQFFAIFDDFSKWSTPKALRKFEKATIMTIYLCKNKRKTLFNLRSTPFLALINGCRSQTPDFRDLVHH